MEYEGRICRGPMERASYMLPVAVGCSYNACRFCMLFKHLQYRELPLEQIAAELQRIHALKAAPKVVYLGDGNAMHLSHERMMTILRMIERYLPNKPEVRMDATVTDILARSDEQLQELIETVEDCEGYINRVSQYISNKGRSYNNCFETIIKWAKQDGKYRVKSNKTIRAFPVFED